MTAREQLCYRSRRRDELRRRIGQTFTLAELADAYRAPSGGAAMPSPSARRRRLARTLSLVEAAAFHIYSRGATDYSP